MSDSDASYRQLFSSPQLVRSLFTGIVNEAWLDILDWHNMQPLPSDYIGSPLRQRQGDHVWRIPRKDGTSLYMLLMLEHQSKNDRHMALRVATYCSLLYESLLKRKLLPSKGKQPAMLPILLPVVLYSGVRRWGAATSTIQLIDPSPLLLQPYLLQMRYLLIDEGVLVRQGKLPKNNLATLLFRLEHNQGIEDIQVLMQTIYNATRGREHGELRRAFTVWIRHVLLPRALPKVTIPALSDTADLLEIKTMLSEHSRSWTHQWEMQGRKKGREEGLKEGRVAGKAEGEATLLLRLLTRKFGPLPQAIQQNLQTATPAQLETWSLKILDAETLDEIFTG